MADERISAAVAEVLGQGHSWIDAVALVCSSQLFGPRTAPLEPMPEDVVSRACYRSSFSTPPGRRHLSRCQRCKGLRIAENQEGRPFSKRILSSNEFLYRSIKHSSAADRWLCCKLCNCSS